MSAYPIPHHHPLRPAYESQPMRDWLWTHFKHCGLCVTKRDGATCVLPAGHAQPCEFRPDVDVFIDCVRGRL